MQKKVGRPKKINEDILRKLEYAFSIGCSDREACAYADLASSTFYDYCHANPDFSERKETLKNMPLFKAKVIIDSALTDKDLATAHKVIDRKEGQKVRQEIANADGESFKTENKWVVEVVNAKDANTE